MTAVAPPLAALNGCHVLIVEDEFFQAKDLARALYEAGAVPVGPVPSFRNAVEALDRSDVIDAAVLDINLRGQMAYEVAGVLANRASRSCLRPATIPNWCPRLTATGRYTKSRSGWTAFWPASAAKV